MASSDPTKNPRPPALPPTSWAKRTGFKPRLSGETNASDSGLIPPPMVASNLDLEAGGVATTTGTGSDGVTTPLPPPPIANGGQNDKVKPVVRRKREVMSVNAHNGNGGVVQRRGESVDALLLLVDDDVVLHGHSHMRYELMDTPGLVPIGIYGLQHCLSMLASVILIPLFIVPVMG